LPRRHGRTSPLVQDLPQEEEFQDDALAVGHEVDSDDEPSSTGKKEDSEASPNRKGKRASWFPFELGGGSFSSDESSSSLEYDDDDSNDDDDEEEFKDEEELGELEQASSRLNDLAVFSFVGWTLLGWVPLCMAMYLIHDTLGRIWMAMGPALLLCWNSSSACYFLQTSSSKIRYQVLSLHDDGAQTSSPDDESISIPRRILAGCLGMKRSTSWLQRLQIASVMSCVFDFLGLGVLLSVFYTTHVFYLFLEPDGSIPIEWSYLMDHLHWMSLMGWIIVFGRIVCTMCFLYVARSIRQAQEETKIQQSLEPEGDDEFLEPMEDIIHRMNETVSTSSNMEESSRFPFVGLLHERLRVKGLVHNTNVRRISQMVFLVALSLVLWTIMSATIHLPSWNAPKFDLAKGIASGDCDPLDDTECALPFPSSYHLIPDKHTETGYRVNLNGNSLPPMKGRPQMHPHFLNELDGFSTMAPILFYIEGMKEAHEAYLNSATVSYCGCRHCTLAVLNSMAGEDQSCGDRIKQIQSTQHTTERDACIQVANHYYPTVCGPVCDPTKCEAASAPLQSDPSTSFHYGVSDIPHLQGMNHVALSTTKSSLTLLLDVAAQKLVPHMAEIDTLDPLHPLVIVTPASPLKHNTQYAVAVVNGTHVNGERMQPTRGFLDLFIDKSGATPVKARNAERAHRFQHIVIPSLEKAAPWFDYKADPKSLHLLFDFHTISFSSQTGPVRSVRDISMSHFEDNDWDKHNVKVSKIVEGDCKMPDDGIHTQLARTIHLDLTVPWFLTGYGRGQRGAILDETAISEQKALIQGVAKMVVHIPCSVRASALNIAHGKQISAILEYGHGLFYSRDEASEDYLVRMANDQGYLIVAMDWRGMSIFDLPVVIKTLTSTPRLFQAIRDNLIQGYANKLAMLHFARNGMLESEWLHFHDSFSGKGRLPQMKPMDLLPQVFYGNSQGGILGGGYSAVVSSTGLLDRSILGAPGTPFALVLTRSLDFDGYDKLLLLNFYNNRHVRIFLSLAQMGWDSVEACGILASGAQSELLMPRVLLQAGLGDVIVPTIAAEAAARVFNASTLTGNPRRVFGLHVENGADANSDGPNSALTELLYESEFDALTRSINTGSPIDFNSVHFRIRHDQAMIRQAQEFITTGRIIDPCLQDGCIR